METKERLMLKYALGGIVLSTSLHSAALSLGGSSGQAIIGRPLDISVRSSAPLADIESAGCLLAEVQYGDSVLPASSVSLSVQAAGDGALIRVRSSVPVNEPVVSVVLQTGCAADRYSRKYTLLADLDPALAPPPAVASPPLVVLSPRTGAPAQPSPLPSLPPLAPSSPGAVLADPAPIAANPVRPSPPARQTPPPAPQAAASPPRPKPAARPPARPKPVAAKQAVAAPAAPKAAAAAPVAPAPAPAGSRLKLDPVDLSPGQHPGLKLNTELQGPLTGTEADRKAAAELWAALNTPPDKAAEDARRLASMEAELKALREQQAGLQASMAALTAQIQAERDELAPKSLLYALAAALVLAGAALAWLLTERKRQRATQGQGDLPWWQSVQDSGGVASLPASTPSAPTLAAAPAAPVTQAAAVAFPEVDDNAMAALHVNEATESSFAAFTEDAPVSLEALLDLVQQVEFFESLQQNTEATLVLEQFVEEHPSSCELPYLLMMQHAQAQGDTERLRELARRFELAFGAQAPDVTCYTPGVAGLDTQSKFIDVLTRFWPDEQVLGLLRNTVLAPPGTGLLEKHSLQAFEDALLLYSVAHTLLGDTDLRAPGPAPEAVASWVAPAAGAVAAVAAPVPAPAPVESDGGLDLDLSFTPDHDIPAPAEAPVPTDEAQGRELPMLDFDLFAIEEEDKAGQPPAKT